MPGKILVLGATGTVGSKVIRTLIARGERTKAACRKSVSIPGVDAVAFDYLDASTYGCALKGVDRIFVITPTGCLDPVRLLTPIIQAAAARGIKIVLMTMLGVDTGGSNSYRTVELFLEETCAPFVIVRPNWFADNFHSYWLAGIRRGVIAVPAADGKTSFIDTRDIAESIACTLTSDAFNGQAFDLTGPEALSYAEAAAILSRAIGRTIAYTPVDDAIFIGLLTEAGISATYAHLLAELFRPVREGRMAALSNGVETLTGKAPRSLETYAKDNITALTA
ncbi:SDR family oxidoreductase [Sinorhizobium sp. 7-81]|uniref:SDR family oxidoreductase n=1 Tax=Sinorhizobium sp. 8-89 TaxID=3049089 RepID=UPI0024C32A5F|nr:SDR family oxidoreductase [Sinorhizobium sp. 8-89]MDK1488912.1 SDR family oxidoreductase [Sinorhizobium sp. 8-89]